MDKKESSSSQEHIAKEETGKRKDFKNLSSAEQAKILKKHNPEAFAKINREIEQRSASFRKVMNVFTFVLAAFLIYYLFIR